MSDSTEKRKLDNRYRLLEQIGQGSMGRVFLAEDMVLGDVKVAIKFLAQALLSDKLKERFVQEATTCAQLGQKSIHVVRVTDYGVSEDEVPFYVMEYLRGKSLGDIISAQPLAIPRFLAICRQICLGLAAAHEGIVIKGNRFPIIHRDIKPSNILVTQDPTLGELAKILDFGIAKLMQTGADQTNCFMGTLAYASPEQMEGRELDSRSDIYSLGIMMFQMLTGRLPVKAETNSFGGWYRAHHSQPPRSFVAVDQALKIPKRLETLVMSCLEKNPDNRPSSVEVILDDLVPLEERFGAGLRISRQIGHTLARLPVAETEPEDKQEVSEDQFCRLVSWPKEKPVAEIVFPKVLRMGDRKLSSIWLMLPQTAFQSGDIRILYNNCICTMSPHPMVLWLTVLHTKEQGLRWLPCYLDLKQSAGQELAVLLGQTGRYKLLFFSSDEPQNYPQVLTAGMAASQCKLLKEWVTLGRVQVSIGKPHQSKDLLRNELNTVLKPKIQKTLEATLSNTFC
ncbi:MAG: serine/threonine protein kinase [Leptolyngbyaceae cyanobacterium SL_1_1]|nr:serine/threonine protein kinase [Leptolyngbyaceae cyanobacterium RM1_1_2]NJO10980.1 serine/threonine protein kinase [Leptolyngbyaceae cyanobacterium SL_1_1]